VSAVSRGLIVHDVLERIREDAELDGLLDDAISRRDENAPEVETKRGMEYRDHLRDEVERVANQPEYRAIAELPTARRELPFLHIAGEDEFYEGSIDLAAVEDNKYVLLDVKTPQCGAAAAREKVKSYRPQRDIYVTAVEAIGGMEVERFVFQFSRAELQVSEEISSVERHRAALDVSGTRRRIEEADHTITSIESECVFCGYGNAGLCSGGTRNG
jgi:ATP-dependent exoDNAse (exonuclease V) beta subunit